MHRVHVESALGATVVHAEGELDAFAAPELSAIFDDAVREPRVVVDLGSVSFMDSTALAVVTRSLRRIREAGGDVRIVLPRATARRIFEITTLDRVLPVSASRAEALTELVTEL